MEDVTPNRGIDADFLSLPRHELADAALSAAVAAGATHADLRIHRLVTEIIQLRDGELETAVVNRDIGLAVRVIVDGTWGFASHAELSPDVAAQTARRAVSVATHAGRAEHRPRRAGGRAGVHRRHLGVALSTSTRSRCPPPTRSPCSTNTPAGCWPPTVSITCRPG